MNNIYIDVGYHESRVAVVEDGRLVEIHIERENMRGLAGNIYKGVVKNVLPGMQAAFVDIGLEKNSFLYIKDIMDYNALSSEGITEGISINRILKQGDELLVQVSRESAGTKGSRITTHITLPGRYVVLMPYTDYIGVSRRIETAGEKDRLKSIVSSLKPEGMGLIVRTEAEGKSEADFVDDINFLVSLWEKIKYNGAHTNAPGLVHKDADLVFRSVRDLFNRDTKAMVINNRDAYERAREMVRDFSPGQAEIIEYYGFGVDMLEYYGLKDEIDKALSRVVRLKSGGYIVIDHTEALTSIDVNTGKYTGSSSLKQTVLDTNLEAACEIARQLRLRDIGGIIIIDFIDMAEENHKNCVIETLKEELKKDRTRSIVLGITQLGLVEMTRKKVSKRLSSILEKQCPVCRGSGRVLDEDTIIMSIERKLQTVFKESDVPAVAIEVNDALESYINEHEDGRLKSVGESWGRKIILIGLSEIEYSQYNIRYISDVNDANQKLWMSEGAKVEINAKKSKYLNSSARLHKLSGRIEKIITDDNGNVSKILVDL